jgi:Skp family chaperone for outer membrane proteins
MKQLRIVAPLIGSSLLLMGLSVPGCPNTEALQQSVDGLKTSEIELKAKANAADTSIKAMKEEVAALKAQLTEVSTTVLAQKAALEEMSKKVTDMEASSKGTGSKGKTKKK